MVEEARGSDLSQARALFARLNPELPGEIAETVTHESKLFVAKDDAGVVVGLLLVDVINYGLVILAEIYELEVDPAADAVATGQELIEACEQWCARRGAITLSVSVTTDVGCVLYAGTGFRPELPPQDMVKVIWPPVARSAPSEPSAWR